MKHNWEYKPLGDCFSYIKNGANIKQSRDAGGFPITRIETLSNGVFNRDRVGFADITDLSIYNNHILQDGNLLMSHINSKTYVGRTVKYSAKPNEVFIHGMNLLRLIPYDWINSQYFYYFTNSYLFKSKIINIRKDAVNQSSFSISDLKKIPTPVPPMEVQERIVAELDKINELIEVKREQLKQLDSLAQSIFYDTFGDPITNPKGWSVNTWENVLTIINGKNQKAVENANGQYPIYGSGGIMNYADDFLCPEFCTIIGRKGNISKPIFVKTKFWNVDTAFGLNANREVLNPLFLFYFCKNYDFEKHNKAVTIPSLVKKDLLKIYIPVPPLSLQQQFAAKVEAIEAQKAMVEKSIAELQTLLDSRMDYWFN